MLVQEVVLQYVQLEKELKDALQTGDDARILELDLQLELCFAKLLDLTPANKNDRIVKFTFLLDRLSPPEACDDLEKTIRLKIIELALTQ